MSLILAFCAALISAFNNLSMRKSIDAGGSSKGFLVTSMSVAIAVSTFLGPIKTGFYAWNNAIAIVGLITGLFLGVMMWSLGKALEKGPPGLTIAYLNASNLVPAILMVLLFGLAFGFQYGPWNALGSLFVIVGLFWAVWNSSKEFKSQEFWLTFATLSFTAHVVFLMLIQWRSLLVNPGLPSSQLIPFNVSPEEAEWFMPMLFIAAASFLVYRFKKEENRSIRPTEVRFGLFGGLCNGVSTFCLVKAAHLASAMESAMIFPIFAVGIVLICNIWGKVLYQEKVHWRAMALCLIGLFVGTMNWSSLLS